MLNVFGQVLLERNELVAAAIVNVQQFYFANRRSNRGYRKTIFGLHCGDLLKLLLSQIHRILDAATDINEPNGVVLQASSGQRGVLLNSKLLIGRFVGKSTK